MSEGDPGGFRFGLSGAVLTYPPLLHCWSLVDPSKSRIRKVKYTNTFTSPLFLTKKRERYTELPFGSCLPACLPAC